MKKIFVIILTICLCLTMLFAFTGCNEAEFIQHNLSRDSDAFNVYRKVTFINLRTNEVLLEVTGYISIQDSGADEIAVIVKTDNDEYLMHYLYVGGEVVYLVQQLDEKDYDSHSWEIHIFAAYPTVEVDW